VPTHSWVTVLAQVATSLPNLPVRRIFAKRRSIQKVFVLVFYYFCGLAFEIFKSCKLAFKISKNWMVPKKKAEKLLKTNKKLKTNNPRRH
jgi:hypothetical protein